MQQSNKISRENWHFAVVLVPRGCENTCEIHKVAIYSTTIFVSLFVFFF